MMSYPIRLASVLTGATIYQLRSWSAKGILTPEVHNKRPPLYSYRDLVALRSVVRLRSATSLQRIGVAFNNLNLVDLLEHPSKYRFATNGKTIVVDDGEGSIIDLIGQTGQSEVLTFEQIQEAFVDFKGREVVNFRRPSEFVEVELGRMGGWPTIAGTRVPYDLISKLVDGLTITADDVPEYYPSVSAAAARDAVRFARSVESVGQLKSA
jgi:uncharacterized protein (DUF433 family)/DNA-binding transcriptional MerR regulator